MNPAIFVLPNPANYSQSERYQALDRDKPANAKIPFKTALHQDIFFKHWGENNTLTSHHGEIDRLFAAIFPDRYRAEGRGRDCDRWKFGAGIRALSSPGQCVQRTRKEEAHQEV